MAIKPSSSVTLIRSGDQPRRATASATLERPRSRAGPHSDVGRWTNTPVGPWHGQEGARTSVTVEEVEWLTRRIMANDSAHLQAPDAGRPATRSASAAAPARAWARRPAEGARARRPVSRHIHELARLRGRSDADAAPPPEARLQEPVPRGDRSRSTSATSRALRRRRDGRRRRAARARAWCQAAATTGEDPRRGRARPRSSPSRRTAFSASAKEKIEKAGGTVEVVATAHAKAAAG